jgi:RHS repeat-associated protein
MKQYNEAGQLQNSFLHGSEAQHLHARNYTYNIRGWLTGINSLSSGIDGNLFGMRLYYNDVPNEAAAYAVGRYNGNIAAMMWTTANITPTQLHSGYAYSYDQLNRLTRAVYYQHEPSKTEYLLASDDSRRYSYGSVDGVGTVDNISYDRNGNILGLRRTASSAGQSLIFDELNYFYSGNRLLAVDDNIKGQTTLGDFTDNGRRYIGFDPEYHYDPNGNVTNDENRSLKIAYTQGNNMPAMIAHEGGIIANRYSFGGQKLGRSFTDMYGQLVSDETYYGNLVMEQRNPSRILFEDGYIDLTPGQQAVFNYHLKDHLGNVRVVLRPDINNLFGAVVQSNDYFPFGMAYTRERVRFNPPLYISLSEVSATAENITFTKDNRYLYNGKEEQPMPGKWLDYGARFYDAQLGRWHSVDPLAEAFISFTPYHYVRNNPVKLYDINGMGDNDWFDKQQEIDANYNAQNDAMFNAIMTGPALGKTQTVKNTDEKKKKNEGDGGDSAQSGGGSVFSSAVPIALTAAAADGPIPIGDVIGAVILAGATAYDATQRTFVTYTMRNAAGQTYVGRTSGYGDPYSIMMNRASGHHMKAFGYGSPVLDRAVQGYQGYPAIRGREQQLIDSYGGIGSPGVGNSIRGVSPYNPAYPIYHGASNLYFGPLAPYTGY